MFFILFGLICFVQCKLDFFEMFDQDHDNILSRHEIKLSGCRMRANISHCIEGVSDFEISSILKGLDWDQSGSISKKEFNRVLHSPVLGGPQQIHLATTSRVDEMLVQWVTRNKDKPIVQYGTTSGQYAFTNTGSSATYSVGMDGWKGWVHTVTMMNLTSNTKYYYKVGQSDNLSGEYYFTSNPRPTDSKKFENNLFAVVADMGTVIPFGWAVTERIVADNKKTPFSLVLHAGDVCYAGTGCCEELEEVWDVWGDQMEPIAAYVPYMFAVGNHEHYYNFTSFTTRYKMPSQGCGGYSNFWYSIDYGNVHFTFMSTEHPYDAKSDQYKWLQNDLAKAHANRKVTPWIVMLGHRPMYCSDSSEYDSHKPGAPFQQEIEPLMVKYSVDLYLCGHMHMYERIFPNIDGVNKGGNGPIFRQPNATAHVNQATAGVFLDSASEYISPQPSWSASRINKWGYGQMAVNATHLHYSFHRMVESDIYDQFWLVK